MLFVLCVSHDTRVKKVYVNFMSSSHDINVYTFLAYLMRIS